MKKIGIFGGTFDPVHNEHIALARAAVRELELDSLLVIPAYAAPHKNGRRETEAEYRFQMAKRAFAGIERVRVSDLELAREGTSYTYLTVEAVARMFPDAALYFLVGGDMLRDFKTWKNPERILAAATLVAAAREGDDADFSEEARYFGERLGKSFLRLTYRGKAVSATKIRTYLAFGLPAPDLPPRRRITSARTRFTGETRLRKRSRVR